LTLYQNQITYKPVLNCDHDEADEDIGVQLFINGGLGLNEFATFVYGMANGAAKITDQATPTESPLTLSAYPNPNTGFVNLTVSGDRGHIVSMNVINILGQVVQAVPNLDLSSTNEQMPLSLSNLPTGNYIIRAVEDEGSTASVMITIQK
jgi:Secretion system C-terminal sorting domain